jgi:hypothetical protein
MIGNVNSNEKENLNIDDVQIFKKSENTKKVISVNTDERVILA